MLTRCLCDRIVRTALFILEIGIRPQCDKRHSEHRSLVQDRQRQHGCAFVILLVDACLRCDFFANKYASGIGLVELFKVGQTSEPYPGPGD